MMIDLLDIKPNEKHGEYKPLGHPNENSSLPLEFAVILPKMMKEAGIPAIEITGGGESTLWGGFDVFLEELIKDEIEIGLVTNGSSLGGNRIDLLAKHALWVRFSMDSSTAELHKLIHRTGGNQFDSIISNIKSLVEKKGSQLTIGISFIITPENQHNIINSCKFYKELGVDNIRFSWMYDKEGKAGLTLEEIEKVKTILKELKRLYDSDIFKVYSEHNRIDLYSTNNSDFSKCYMQRFVWAVGANCRVYPCCIVKYFPNMEIGNIKERSLKEMVDDMNINIQMDSLNPMNCPPCWLRERNKAMAQAIEKPKHVNFV